MLKQKENDKELQRFKTNFSYVEASQKKRIQYQESIKYMRIQVLYILMKAASIWLCAKTEAWGRNSENSVGKKSRK
ncbi:hypothetical protein [Holospora undulata]|uniref:hypothetical protein n=1 Tax=Holospora undulata TaxID=1169117 RepID=UPI0003308718|nr:hypothetical protein [Holospora undulata]